MGELCEKSDFGADFPHLGIGLARLWRSEGCQQTFRSERRWVLVLAVLGLAMLAHPGRAQSAMATEDLIRRHRASLGSTAALQAFQSVAWEGELTVRGESFRVRELRAAPSSFRREVSQGDRQWVEVSNGESFWRWSETGGQRSDAELLTGETAAWLGVGGPLFPSWWSGLPGATSGVSTSGIQRHPEITPAVYRLSWTEQEQFDVTAFINIYDFRMLRQEIRHRSHPTAAPVVLKFRDFRTFSDLTFPTTVEMLIGESPLSVLRITTVDVRPLVFRQAFEPVPVRRRRPEAVGEP